MQPVRSDTTSIQLSKDGAPIACGGTLNAGDTNLKFVISGNPLNFQSDNFEFLIDTFATAGAGSWGIQSGECKNLRAYNSAGKSYTGMYTHTQSMYTRYVRHTYAVCVCVCVHILVKMQLRSSKQTIYRDMDIATVPPSGEVTIRAAWSTGERVKISISPDCKYTVTGTLGAAAATTKFATSSSSLASLIMAFTIISYTTASCL